MTDETRPKRTLTDDDVKVERVRTTRTSGAIKGTQPAHPDDPDRRAPAPANDHDA